MPVPDKPSIAILPFSNMGGELEDEYFADGMAEEITNALSRCSSLFVIARSSSYTYKGRSIDVRQVGRELGVRYVLEGSVRRGGDHLRIAGQLTDAISGRIIWADRFDGRRGEVFALQDHVTECVVAAIEPSLQAAEIERLKHKSEANLDAYDLLLRAQQLEYELTESSLAAAIGHIQSAIAIDPFYAPAMALGAYCYAVRRFQGWEKEPENEEAEGVRLAERALEFGHDDSNVLWMSGYAFRELAMDVPRCKVLVGRSLQINPNSAIALTIAAWNEIVLENPVGALEILNRAERLSPRDPRAWFMANARTLANLALGQFEQAAISAKRSLAQNPRSAQARRMLTSALANMGNKEGAHRALIEVMKHEPNLTLGELRGRLKFMPDSIWYNLGGGLRIAGLAE
jgi:TolB-like protein